MKTLLRVLLSALLPIAQWPAVALAGDSYPWDGKKASWSDWYVVVEEGKQSPEYYCHKEDCAIKTTQPVALGTPGAQDFRLVDFGGANPLQPPGSVFPFQSDSGTPIILNGGGRRSPLLAGGPDVQWNPLLYYNAGRPQRALDTTLFTGLDPRNSGDLIRLYDPSLQTGGNRLLTRQPSGPQVYVIVRKDGSIIWKTGEELNNNAAFQTGFNRISGGENNPVLLADSLPSLRDSNRGLVWLPKDTRTIVLDGGRDERLPVFNAGPVLPTASFTGSADPIVVFETDQGPLFGTMEQLNAVLAGKREEKGLTITLASDNGASDGTEGRLWKKPGTEVPLFVKKETGGGSPPTVAFERAAVSLVYKNGRAELTGGKAADVRAQGGVSDIVAVYKPKPKPKTKPKSLTADAQKAGEFWKALTPLETSVWRAALVEKGYTSAKVDSTAADLAARAEKDEAALKEKTAAAKSGVGEKIKSYLGEALDAGSPLTKFEAAYLRERLGRLDASYPEAFGALAAEAAKDPEAGKVMHDRLRAMIRKDFDAYSLASGDPDADTALAAWAGSRLKEGATIAEAFKEEPSGDGKEDKKKESTPEDPLAAEIHRLAFAKSAAYQKVLAGQVIADKGGREQAAAYLKTLKDPAALDKDYPPEAVREKAAAAIKAGSADKDMLDLFCPDFFGGAGASGAVTADGAKDHAEKIRDGRLGFDRKGESGDGVDATPPPGDTRDMKLVAACKAWAENNKTAERTKGFLTMEKVPPVGKAGNLLADSEKGGEKKGPGVGDSLKKAAFPAAVGAAGFGIIGFLLMGPFGLVMGALAGAALMGGMAMMNSGGGQ